MVIGKRRCCKRKFSVRNACLIAVGCLLTVYVVSVIHRAPKSRNIWDVSGFKNTTDGLCGVECPYGQASFYIKSGVENKEGPTVCFRNKVLLSEGKQNVHRGINLVIIDDASLEVVDQKVFDTYIDDTHFLDFMKTSVQDRHIIIAASYDEISDGLKEQGRLWLKLFGAEYIDQVSFRDAYLLIGQKGLKQGYGIEFVERRGSERYSRPIEKLGCLSIPMGPVLKVADALSQVARFAKVKVGDELAQCGVEKACRETEFPVRVYTGTDSTKFPEICVGGKMVMTKKLNDAGRGINIVIVDPISMQPKMVSRFDTYEKSSTNLESFLESLAHGDIVIAVVFDDASRKLNYHAKEVLNQLGSSMIQNLKFRDVWYFIGQKGIDGFTNIEKISFAGMDAEWPKPLQTSVCVPTKIKGSPIVPDPPATRNDARRAFCKKYDGYADFCDSVHVDDPIPKPVELIEDSLKKNPVYASPIVIVPGLNPNALVQTIETIVMQPGVKLENIVVSFDEKFPEQGEVASLFGLRNISTSSSLSYEDQMKKSMAKVAKLYPKAPFMIVMEEELLASPDFMYFLAQTSPTLDKDPTLAGVSAYNFNGLEGTSGNKSLVYRVEEFPGLAFMIKMSVYRDKLRDNFSPQRAWYGWSPADNQTGRAAGLWEMLVPDLSRALRLPYEGSGPSEQYLTGLFNIPRLTSTEGKSKVLGQDYLTGARYDHWTSVLLKKARQIHTDDLQTCVKSAGKFPVKFTSKGGIYVVYYNQDGPDDYKNLVKLCKCFRLPSLDGHKPKNLYHGLLRFTYMGNSVFLTGSSSRFAGIKPSDVKFLQL